MDDPNFWSKMLPEDSMAAAADAAVAAQHSGADRIKPIKM